MQWCHHCCTVADIDELSQLCHTPPWDLADSYLVHARLSHVEILTEGSTCWMSRSTLQWIFQQSVMIKTCFKSMNRLTNESVCNIRIVWSPCLYLEALPLFSGGSSKCVHVHLAHILTNLVKLPKILFTQARDVYSSHVYCSIKQYFR